MRCIRSCFGQRGGSVGDTGRRCRFALVLAAVLLSCAVAGLAHASADAAEDDDLALIKVDHWLGAQEYRYVEDSQSYYLDGPSSNFILKGDVHPTFYLKEGTSMFVNTDGGGGIATIFLARGYTVSTEEANYHTSLEPHTVGGKVRMYANADNIQVFGEVDAVKHGKTFDGDEFGAQYKTFYLGTVPEVGSAVAEKGFEVSEIAMYAVAALAFAVVAIVAYKVLKR